MSIDTEHPISGTLAVQGMEWFDSVNGNSYCSVRVHWEDELIAVAPFQYGYGDFYEQAASEELTDWFESMGIDSVYSNGMTRPLWQIAQDAGFRLDTHIATGRGRREVEAWGKNMIEILTEGEDNEQEHRN